MRELVWDGCRNVRDLGGLPTEVGATTRFGSVVRADCVRKLSPSGWEALVAYGVRTIVDLRRDDEREGDPQLEVPVDVLHAPLFGDDELFAVLERAEEIEDPVARMRFVYGRFLDLRRPYFAGAVTAIARAGDGGVVVHCAGGKDRTGLLTALLLRLVGVGPAEIAADYAISERNLMPARELLEAEFGDRAEHELGWWTAGERAMVEVVGELERRHGSAREFLRRGGASDEDLDRARARLVA